MPVISVLVVSSSKYKTHKRDSLDISVKRYPNCKMKVDLFGADFKYLVVSDLYKLARITA